jgi:hypothetical protein
MRLHPRLFIGGFIDAPIDYSVDEKINHEKSTLDSTASFDFTLPLSWSAGIAAGLTDRWWISSSWISRKAPEPSGFPQLEGLLSNRTHFGIGLERRCGQGDDFFSRIPFRAGFYTDSWHLEFPEGKPVRSYFFTIGSAVILRNAGGSLDFGFEFGTIGSSDENGVEERMFRFDMSLSISEPWARRKTERH